MKKSKKAKKLPDVKKHLIGDIRAEKKEIADDKKLIKKLK